jgi:hypothetical protein
LWSLILHWKGCPIWKEESQLARIMKDSSKITLEPVRGPTRTSCLIQFASQQNVKWLLVRNQGPSPCFRTDAWLKGPVWLCKVVCQQMSHFIFHWSAILSMHQSLVLNMQISTIICWTVVKYY